MLRKLKNLSNRLKLYRQEVARRRIYIVPSFAGAFLSILVIATYLLSFMDRNPWLTSVAILGFGWFVVSLLLTHRIIHQLDISSDGKITNRSGEVRTGIHVDGVEIADIPAYGSVRVAVPPHQKRFRVSTFSPTGFFYSWAFQKTKKAESSDLGESVVWRRGNSLARVDWKLWFRRGRFVANASDPNFRLRPITESQHESGRVFARKSRTVASDAGLWALFWSFIVIVALGLMGLRFAPLWTGVLVFLWAALFALGVFPREKYRYWGKVNFFVSWILLVLVLVAAKDFLEPWMISTASIALLFIPFTLHMKLSATDNMFRRIGGILAIAVLTSLTLNYSQAFIAERFQSRRFGFGGFGGESNTNWGPSLASTSLRNADRFLARGQGIFWVDFSREDQMRYIRKLPYWRENTYTESRGGLNWSGKVSAADAGTPLMVNLFLPGRDPLLLQREPPTLISAVTVTAYDRPANRESYLSSLRIQQVVAGLKLNPQQPVEASAKVIEWMRGQSLHYSLRPGRIADVDDLLFRKKQGLCQHYAGALAYILRAAKLPARVVGGYYGGEVDADDETLLMRDLDAHAWVEVWNPEAKHWFLVDPTAALFPNEFRLDNGNKWLRSLTRFIVVVQKRWIRLQDQVVNIAVVLAGLALLLGGVAVWRARKKRVAMVDTFESSQKVREWEARMLSQFNEARNPSEGLNTYYTRATASVSNAEAASQLKAELDKLIRELYAP